MSPIAGLNHSLFREEPVMNSDSSSFGFRRRSPGTCMFTQRPAPPHASLGLRPHGRNRRAKGAGRVELIGVRAQTSWDLEETRAGEPLLAPGERHTTASTKATYLPQVFTLVKLGLLLSAGLCPKLART